MGCAHNEFVFFFKSLIENYLIASINSKFKNKNKTFTGFSNGTAKKMNNLKKVCVEVRRATFVGIKLCEKQCSARDRRGK